jgi:hypothetical protein
VITQCIVIIRQEFGLTDETTNAVPTHSRARISRLIQVVKVSAGCKQSPANSAALRSRFAVEKNPAAETIEFIHRDNLYF